MASTQDHLIISDIKNDLALLKDGSVCLILSTTAVNFGLLSEEEQIAIIYSFAGLLNSLSFPIQIVIRSKILDISFYVGRLEVALQGQTNPLLKRLTTSYKEFVKNVIKDNEVLDKQFYIIINVTSIEIGLLTKKVEDKFKKAQTILTPRKDHLIRQLTRVGLKGKQLTNDALVTLFYDIYNNSEGSVTLTPDLIGGKQSPQIQIASSGSTSLTIPRNDVPTLGQPRPLNIPQPPIITPPDTGYPQPPITNQPPKTVIFYPPPPQSRRSPFFVEELTD